MEQVISRNTDSFLEIEQVISRNTDSFLETREWFLELIFSNEPRWPELSSWNPSWPELYKWGAHFPQKVLWDGGVGPLNFSDFVYDGLLPANT